MKVSQKLKDVYNRAKKAEQEKKDAMMYLDSASMIELGLKKGQVVTGREIIMSGSLGKEAQYTIVGARMIIPEWDTTNTPCISVTAKNLGNDRGVSLGIVNGVDVRGVDFGQGL